MGSELALLTWTRPWALALLVLPLIAWLLARRPTDPTPIPTSTTALWRELAGDASARAHRSRRRVPRALRWALLAWVLALLALGAPRIRAAAPVSDWHVLVDRSPSMFLPAPAGEARRIDAALSRAQSFLGRRGVPPERRVWVSRDGAAELVVRAPQAPAHWRARAADAPDWPRWDRARVLWVSDVSPSPVRASACWSGATPVPGPIGSSYEGGEHVLWVWEGSATRRVRFAGERPTVLLRAVGPTVAEWVRVWAQHRGYAVSTREPPGDAASQPALVIAGPTRSGTRTVRAGRDGWRAEFDGVGDGIGDTGGSDWLFADGVSLVRSSRGRIELGFEACRPEDGSAEAFAVSWAELLDGGSVGLPGVVALGERVAVGEAGEVDGWEGEENGGGGGWWLCALLAAAAAMSLSGIWSG